MAAKNKENWLNFFRLNQHFERVTFYVKKTAKLIIMYHYDCKKIQMAAKSKMAAENDKIV